MRFFSMKRREDPAPQCGKGGGGCVFCPGGSVHVLRDCSPVRRYKRNLLCGGFQVFYFVAFLEQN
jgi:hypothetical protein